MYGPADTAISSEGRAVTKLPQPTRDLARAEDDLFAHGYCIVADALSSTEVKALRDRLETQASAERDRQIAYEFAGHVRAAGTESFIEVCEPEETAPRHQIVGVLINKGRGFRDLVQHPVPDRLASKLLGADWVLSACDGSIVRPGGPVQPLHTDQWWMPRPQARRERQRPPGEIRRGEYYGEVDDDPARPISAAVKCAVVWTLSPFSRENGATRVVPGSHLTGLQPDPKRTYDKEAVNICAPAGALVMWDARLWHGVGRNHSDEERLALLMGYAAPMFRSQINFTLATLPEVIVNASPGLLARLGFKTWGGFYGRVDAGKADFARKEDIIGELG